MKNSMKRLALAMLIGSSLLGGSLARAQQSREDQERDERIRYNLRQGAFNLNGGVYNKDGMSSVPSISLKGLSESQLRDRLQTFGVSYFFRLDESDLRKEEDAPFYSVQDFMGNATAESRGGTKFKAEACGGENSTSKAAHFKRNSKVEDTGGYLLVKEADPSTTNLSPYEGFSVGSWIQLNNQVTSGSFPILTKTPMNQINPQGKHEWTFFVTGNVVYLNVSRQGRTQNLNFNLPWWGDRFGSCYERGIYRDCWHYVGISFDPASNKMAVLFLRKFANKLPGAAAENFHIYETSAQENALPIDTSTQTPLRIGGANASSMDGILKGVFFARKALSSSELKAMAQLTEPRMDGLFCARP